MPPALFSMQRKEEPAQRVGSFSHDAFDLYAFRYFIQGSRL